MPTQLPPEVATRHAMLASRVPTAAETRGGTGRERPVCQPLPPLSGMPDCNEEQEKGCNDVRPSLRQHKATPGRRGGEMMESEGFETSGTMARRHQTELPLQV